MSRASAADIFRSIAKVQGLFPPGFNVLTECVRHGVKAIRLKRLAVLDVPACYDPEEKAIELDPGADHGLRRSVEHGSSPVGENFLPPLRGTGAGGRPPPGSTLPPWGRFFLPGEVRAGHGEIACPEGNSFLSIIEN